MYNVKQTQSEIHELKEKLSIQQQKNQLNELSNEREGELWSVENHFAFIINFVVKFLFQYKFCCEISFSIQILLWNFIFNTNFKKLLWSNGCFSFNLHTISSVSFNKEN